MRTELIYFIGLILLCLLGCNSKGNTFSKIEIIETKTGCRLLVGETEYADSVASHCESILQNSNSIVVNVKMSSKKGNAEFNSALRVLEKYAKNNQNIKLNIFDVISDTISIER